MGLDNGITLRFELTNGKSFSNGSTYREYEFCYWRKYWGLRDKIVSMLHTEEEQFEYCLDEDGLECIIAIIKMYDKYNDYGNASTVWSENEEYVHLKTDEFKLGVLLDLIKGKISMYKFITFLEKYGVDDDSNFDELREMVENNKTEYVLKVFFYDSY